MKKKILSLMLAVCVVLGLSACGGERKWKTLWCAPWSKAA